MERTKCPHSSNKALLLIPAFFLFASASKAQKDPCSQQEYKILTPSAVGVRCVDDVNVLGILGGSGTVTLNGDTDQTLANVKVKVSFFKTETTWLLLVLSGNGSSLKPGKKYTLALTYDVKGQATVPPVSINIDTTETVTISPSVVDSSPKTFKAKSTVGFSTSGKTLSFETRRLNQQNQSELETEPCTISVLDSANQVLPIHAMCSKFASLSSESPTEDALAGVEPEEVGIYDITLDSSYKTALVPGPLGFKTVFGTSPKIDPKSRFSPKKAPATKDASQYYINFNYAAGVGTVPAWVLDGQIAPRLWMYDGFTLGPLASADVGNNKLSGQTYTDTIDFGLSSQKPFFYQKKSILEELLLSSAVKYETDKEFDRDNLLAAGDLRYNFAGLYHTHSVVALQNYYEALQKYNDQQKSSGKDSTAVYVPQVDDFQPPLIGYALDFHTGIETGGALVDTTVHASSGKAVQNLPSYSIFRFVPQVHGLLEVWKFTFDANMTGRYLALTENTVRETPAHALILTRVQGWKGILALTTTYNLDSQGHFALNVVFKDGFASPTYKRVNAVQAGILVKY